MADLFGLQGKKAVVIGGGLGMGRASSRLLAEVGAAVSVVDADGERAGATAAELRAAGHSALSLTADVRRRDQAERAIEESLAITILTSMPTDWPELLPILCGRTATTRQTVPMTRWKARPKASKPSVSR